MHSSTFSSDAASITGVRLWLSLFAIGFALVTALLILSIGTQAPYGDLTRIGALSESWFGWHDEQPAIDPNLLRSAPIDQADIVVVGDSFSVSAGPAPHAGLLWQSRLVASGWRVATLHWDGAHPLCPDFHDWLASTGFRGRWVLMESVERALDERLTTARRCGSTARAAPQAFTTWAPATRPPEPRLNLGEQLLTGISTAWNTRRALKTTEPALFKDPAASDSVRLHRWAEGCRHFSHTACDRALFLLDDEKKPPYEAKHLPLMAAATHAAHPWRVAWVIVPNKRTFYLDAASFARTGEAAQAQGLGPNIMGSLQTHAASGRDMYFSNDTHLSSRGSLLLGDAVAQWLAQQPR